MLSDLDALMRDRGIDVVIVPMHESMHPSFRWLARGAKVTRGYAVKFADRDPMIVTYPMERGEAAASGLEVHLASEFGVERRDSFLETGDRCLEAGIPEDRLRDAIRQFLAAQKAAQAAAVKAAQEAAERAARGEKGPVTPPRWPTRPVPLSQRERTVSETPVSASPHGPA